MLPVFKIHLTTALKGDEAPKTTVCMPVTSGLVVYTFKHFEDGLGP